MIDLREMTKDKRYEKKIVIVGNSLKEVEALISFSSGNFKKIHDTRYVNSIYLDDNYFSSYLENVEGFQNRSKVRIRWYGALFGQISNPNLEIKLKNGNVMSKLVYQIPSFDFQNKISISQLRNLIKTAKIPQIISNLALGLCPSIITRYKRMYYLSYDKKIRLTVDTEIEYFLPNNQIKYKEDCIVLEIKYGVDDQVVAQKFIENFPYRLNKNSKYVRGVMQLLS